ncbi:MAG: hypothetical protein NC452_05245 [Eubacterium sp.]|nr:hypothetical protein [Eubacterium sp.]
MASVHIKSEERKAHEAYILESFGRTKGGAVTAADREAAEVIAARTRESYSESKRMEEKYNG